MEECNFFDLRPLFSGTKQGRKVQVRKVEVLGVKVVGSRDSLSK
jgi:hypothetical protein